VIVVAVDDMVQSLKIVDIARTHFPQATLVVRARNVEHQYALRERGVTHIERETFESALVSGRSVLEAMGHEPHHAWQLAARFRRLNRAMVERSWPHRADRKQLMSMSKQGRQQLEEQFAQERAEREQQRSGGWLD
jgi:glutathione-regulated potassium-efflux system ancillary protein KefC